MVSLLTEPIKFVVDGLYVWVFKMVYLYSFFNLGVRWGGRSRPLSGRFNPGKDPVPIVLEAGWASKPVWTVAENLTPAGIQSPDGPALTDCAIPTHQVGAISTKDFTSAEGGSVMTSATICIAAGLVLWGDCV